MKIRKRIILLGLTIGITLGQFIEYENNKAFAENWVYIARTTYIDVDRIQKFDMYGRKNLYAYWIKSFNDGSYIWQKLANHFNTQGAYFISRSIIDCSQEETLLMNAFVYDTYGNIISTYQNEIMHDWKVIVPNSVGKAEYNYICIGKLNG